MSKTAYLFAGQGAQYPGMVKSFYDEIPECRALFEEANDTLGRDIAALCFDGPQEALNLTENTQPCVYVADMVVFKAMSLEFPEADGFAGFSLGEYAALTAAGFISFSDCLRVVSARAKAMQSAVPAGQGGMVATGTKDRTLLEETIAAVDTGYIVGANYNSPEQVVLSGEVAAIDAFIELAKEKKIKVMKLAVSAPFHCDLMRPAAAAIDAELAKAALSDTRVPVYMNVDGMARTVSGDIVDAVKRQVYSPLKWQTTIETMIADGFDRFVELGPGKALSGMNKKIVPEALIVRVGSTEELRDVSEILR